MRRQKPDPAVAAAADERTVRIAAYALLAGRDFSRHELSERLLRKGYGAAAVTDAIAVLVQEGFLREQRYAEPAGAGAQCASAWSCASAA